SITDAFRHRPVAQKQSTRLISERTRSVTARDDHLVPEYLVNMDAGVDDNTIKNVCEEAVRSGEVPGISPNIPKNAFANFVIDRFHGDQTRFVVRPKVPFGV